jgi:hypothetical protein
MKKLFILAIALMAVFALVPTASAIEFDYYDSGIQVQNLSSSTTANVQVTYYNQGGSVECSVSDSIAASSSTTYFPLHSCVDAGFDGSVVISSDQPVAAITNVLGEGINGASYSGFDGGSNVAQFPLVMRNLSNIDSWLNVQNVGTAATTVTLAYSGQASCNQSATIQPGAAATFDQGNHTCLPNGYFGSATATASNASHEIVGTVLQVGNNGLLAYNGFSGGSTNPVMPLIVANVYGNHTGAQIQNLSGSSTTVTVSYTPAAGGGNGTACTETGTIPGNSSSTFVLDPFTADINSNTSNCTFGQYFIGSAQVTTNSGGADLAVIVNQTNFAATGSSYNGFDPATATGTLVMPLIIDAYSIFSGYNVMNVGSSATVTCSYTGLNSSYNDVAVLGTGGVMNAIQFNSGFPANTGGGYIGGATCTATAGGAIIAVVNQAKTGGSGDTVLTYEAFNQ